MPCESGVLSRPQSCHAWERHRIVVSRSHAEARTAPHASNHKESSETEEHEKCGHASFPSPGDVPLVVYLRLRSLPKGASSMSLTRFRMRIRFGLHRK